MARYARNQTRTARDIFGEKIYREITTNPYEHYTQRDFSAQRLENIDGHCVQGQFKHGFNRIGESRLVSQLYAKFTQIVKFFMFFVGCVNVLSIV